jgi:hypothetical protein
LNVALQIHTIEEKQARSSLAASLSGSNNIMKSYEIHSAFGNYHPSLCNDALDQTFLFILKAKCTGSYGIEDCQTKSRQFFQTSR